ncbi:MAG: tetratricopeptide repeat protein [Phycisphaeraceae bacterium JB051]
MIHLTRLFSALLVCSLSVMSYAREMPKLESDKQRVQFLMEGAGRIAPSDKEHYSNCMARIAETYALIGEVDNARRALSGVDKDKRGAPQCEVAKRLVKAGKLDEAEKLIDDLGATQVTTDMSMFGFGVTDHKAEVREMIREARHGELTLKQRYWRLKSAKSQEQVQKELVGVLMAMVDENQMDEFDVGLSKVAKKLDREDIIRHLAKHYAKAGAFDQAYEAARRMEKEKSFGYSLLVQTLIKMHAQTGDDAAVIKAAQSYEGVLKGMETHARRTIAIELAKKGDVEGAIQQIQAVDSKMHGTMASEVCHSLIYGNKPEPDKAVRVLKMFGNDDAVNSVSHTIALGYAKIGNFEKAKHILANAPEDRTNIAYKYIECAGLAFEKSKPALAEEFAQLAVSKLPQLTQHNDKQFIQKCLAKLYIQMGQVDKYMAMIPQIQLPEKNMSDYRREAVEMAGPTLMRNDQIMPLLQSIMQLKNSYVQVLAMCRISEDLMKQDKKK